jgi:hypothetical protein
MRVVPWEVAMQQGHCEEGCKLYLLYKQKAMELLGIESYKRHAVSAATRSEWLEITRVVESANLAYEEARRKYIDHEIGCEVCEQDVPAFYFFGPGAATLSKQTVDSVRT